MLFSREEEEVKRNVDYLPPSSSCLLLPLHPAPVL